MNVINYIIFRYTFWFLLPWSSGWVILLKCLLGHKLQHLAKPLAFLILIVNFFFITYLDRLSHFLLRITQFSLANLSLVLGLSFHYYLHLDPIALPWPCLVFFRLELKCHPLRDDVQANPSEVRASVILSQSTWFYLMLLFYHDPSWHYSPAALLFAER